MKKPKSNWELKLFKKELTKVDSLAEFFRNRTKY